MKKILTVAAIGALIAVAGCSGGKTENENAGGTVKREAGNWKTDVKLVNFEVPGLPAEAKDANGGGECTWSKKEVAGGKIDVAGTCTANGQTVDMAMAGTMEAKKTDVTITTKGKVPTGGDMEMVMQMTSTHTGPCKAATTT